MTVGVGTRLGSYDITELLGAGGMGQVFRARDARLGREVALKLLPETFVLDPDRRARFEREAHALAALNHPNIAQIYGIEDSGVVPALVMELVDGPTLSDRIAQGPLPIADALSIARQIADALAFAHEHAIVHRDLKPANIKVTTDGAVKVLDFGLAKNLDPAAGDAPRPPSDSPTFTTPAMTARGVILGTAAYMAPEQARGRAVDQRADIWAFGVILFEMLTGRPLFAADTVSDTLAAVLRQEIAWDQLPPVPQALRRLLARCLERERARRLHSIVDARLDLDEAAAPVTQEQPRVSSPRSSALAWSVAAIAIVVAGIAAALAARRGSTPEARWDHFVQVTDTEGEEVEPSISPDGKSVAFVSVAAATNASDIFVQRIGGRTRVAVAADPERQERSPAFSPDGQTIAYADARGRGGIFVTGATGESSRRITDFGFSPAWSPDGKWIVFASEDVDEPFVRRSTSPLWIVDATGGAPRKIADGDAVQPAWSPDGKRIAYWGVHGGQRDLYTIPAAGGAPVAVTNDAPVDWAPAWSPDGRYIYFSSDRGGAMNIWRIPIDARTGAAAGLPEIVTTGVESTMVRPSLSASGTRLAFEARTTSLNPMSVPFDPATGHAGTPVALMNRTGVLVPYDVSRDGRSMLLNNIGEQQEDILISNVDGTGLRRITDDPARDRCPVFTPDGRVLFFSNRGGSYAVWSIAPDGGDLRLVGGIPHEDLIYPFLSPSADRLTAISTSGPVIASMSGGTASGWRPLLSNGAAGFGPREWSHDGRRIAGVTMTGIAVYDVASGRVTPLTEADGAGTVRWMPDDRHLVYITNSRNIGLVDADTGATRLSPIASVAQVDANGFAVAPDGRTIYIASVRAESDIWIADRQ